MFRFRLYTPMGSDAGELELAVPTVAPGETLHAGGGRKLLVLDTAYLPADESDFRALLVVEELSRIRGVDA
jgi:hypothetical protein